jgi:hypothetical protein
MDIATIGMVVIFLMAWAIVSWQAKLVTKAEDQLLSTTSEWMVTEELLHKTILENQQLEADKDNLVFDSARANGKLATAITCLRVAQSTLHSISVQNHGDPVYETWARKMAADAKQYIDRKAVKLGPLS